MATNTRHLGENSSDQKALLGTVLLLLFSDIYNGSFQAGWSRSPFILVVGTISAHDGSRLSYAFL